jgi:hypothetical protein
MSMDLHREAERLMALADHASAEGDATAARARWADAAQAEALAFEAIPLDRVRTRGVIAASVVVLRMRAGDMAGAAHDARRFLALGDVAASAGARLSTLLEEATRTESAGR